MIWPSIRSAVRVAAITCTPLVLLGACGSDAEGPEPSPSRSADVSAGAGTAPSFDCLVVLFAGGLTSATPAGVARDNLDSLARVAETPEEADYLESLRDAIDDVPDGEPIGDRLDTVPCDL